MVRPCEPAHRYGADAETHAIREREGRSRQPPGADPAHPRPVLPLALLPGLRHDGRARGWRLPGHRDVRGRRRDHDPGNPPELDGTPRHPPSSSAAARPGPHARRPRSRSGTGRPRSRSPATTCSSLPVTNVRSSAPTGRHPTTCWSLPRDARQRHGRPCRRPSGGIPSSRRHRQGRTGRRSRKPSAQHQRAVSADDVVRNRDPPLRRGRIPRRTARGHACLGLRRIPGPFGRACLEPPELPESVAEKTPLRASGFHAPDLALGDHTFVPAEATMVTAPDGTRARPRTPDRAPAGGPPPPPGHPAGAHGLRGVRMRRAQERPASRCERPGRTRGGDGVETAP